MCPNQESVNGAVDYFRQRFVLEGIDEPVRLRFLERPQPVGLAETMDVGRCWIITLLIVPRKHVRYA